MEKSYVTMERKVCPVTGKTFGSGDILFDKHLRNRFDMSTITGWQICPKVQEQLDKGYIALVEADSEKSEFLPNGNIKPEGAYRTGVVAFIRKEVADRIFNMPIDTPFVFVDPGVIPLIQSKMPPEAVSVQDG